jgi:hypothetical protein
MALMLSNSAETGCSAVGTEDLEQRKKQRGAKDVGGFQLPKS